MRKNNLTILHTICHGEWGGMERRVYNESRWMSRKGHKIVIVAPTGTPIYKKAVEEGWQTCNIRFKKLGLICDIRRLRSFFRKIRPDVINTHGNMDTKVGLTAAFGLKIPCVILSRHITPPVQNVLHNRILYQRMCRYIFTTAGCTTRQIIRDLGVSEDRVFTMPSGIAPPPKMLSHDRARRMLAEELKLDSSSRFIGFVGRISREKGVFCLIDAFDKIKDRYPNHHLALVGTGYYLSDFEERIRQCGLQYRVHILGFRNVPWPYYRAFDCKILGSLEHEGIPQSLLEAMFAGCPVICTNVGGIPDVIRHQDTGTLVTPGDSTQLAGAIMETIEYPEKAEAMAGRAARFVNAHNTIDVMGETILKLYNKIN